MFDGCIDSLLRPAGWTVALALLTTVAQAQVAPGGENRHRGVARARGVRGAASVATSAPPNVPYNGGAVMPDSTTYAIWWGNSADFPSDAQAGIDEFLEGLEGSEYLAIADQYMFGRKAHTRFGGNFYDHSPVSPDPIDPVTYADIFGAEVCKVLGENKVKPDPNAIYMVYTSNFPLDMTTVLGACAFHEPATCSDGTVIKLAYVPNSSIADGCNPSAVPPFFTADKRSEGTRAMANVTAHEFMETITDPNIDAWVNLSNYSEIADQCAWIFFRGVPLADSRWKIQDIWSNQAGGCLQGAGHEALVLGDISSSGATTAFTVPDATYGLFSHSINAKGAAAGDWVDAGNAIHGFVRDNHGNIATFNAPGDGFGGSTSADSINAAGAVTGNYSDLNLIAHGYIRDSFGNFTAIDVPGAGTGLFAGTVAQGINSNGDLTGFYSDASYVTHAFVRTRVGNLLTFDVPGASSHFLSGTWGTSINANGDVAGGYDDSNFAQHGFVRHSNGAIATFDAPHAPNGTFANGINDSGTVAGDYLDSGFLSHGFIRDAHGNITTFDAPGSFLGTFAYDINAEGAVAGYYSDANGFPHAYVRDKAGNFTVTQLPGANYGTVAQSINDAGATAGTVTVPAQNQ